MDSLDNYGDLLSALLSASEENNELFESLLMSYKNVFDDDFVDFFQTTIFQWIEESKSDSDMMESIASCMITLSGCFFYSIKGNTIYNIEMAIIAHQSASYIYTSLTNHEEWAFTQLFLSMLYLTRIKENKVENIQKAFEYCNESLIFYTKNDHPENWATAKANLANILIHMQHGDVWIHKEKAIEYCNEALEVFTQNSYPEQWADIQTLLGQVYNDRLIDESEDNRQMAIKYLNLALSVFTLQDFPNKWIATQIILGSALPDGSDTQIETYKNILKIIEQSEDFRTWAIVQRNLGDAYVAKGNTEQNEKYIKYAIEIYEKILIVYKRNNEMRSWAMTQYAMGGAYISLDQNDKSLECWKSGLEVIKKHGTPQDLLIFGVTYGSHALNKFKLFPESIQGLSLIIDSIEQDRFWIRSDSRRHEIYSKYTTAYAILADTCIKNDQPKVAIEYVERSKARNLVELMHNRNIYPKPENFAPFEYKDICEHLNQLRKEIPATQRLLDIAKQSNQINHIEQLQMTLDKLHKKEDDIFKKITLNDPFFKSTQIVTSLPFDDIITLFDENSVIIEWFITDESLYTFIITHQEPFVKCFISDSNILKQLNEVRDKYIQILKERISPRQIVLNNIMKELSEILQLNHILELIPDTCKHLIFVPHRFLHLFPLHALILNDHSYLIEHSYCSFGVSYIPSCQILQNIQKQKYNSRKLDYLFAIQDPSDNLPASNLEVEVISHLFDSSTIFRKYNAKHSTIKTHDKLLACNCTHFSCHGEFNFSQPLNSFLVLANEEHLTLAEIFGLSLPQCSLITLSACETGIIDFNNITDEYIGLPSGFLYAGSQCVISSLWKVDSFSTTLLMIKFYTYLRKYYQDNNYLPAWKIANALNKSQKWLKNITCKEVLVEIEKYQLHIETIRLYSSPGSFFEFNDTLNIELHKIKNNEPYQKPFEHPYYWAGFIATGI